jgi:cell division protein FtsB
MTSPLLDNAPYGAYAILLGMLVKFLYRRIRPWIRTREEMAKNKAKARRQTAALFSAFVFACAVALALLVLLAVTLPQTSPRTPIILLLAGAVGALGVMGALLLVFGLPAYNYVIDLEEQYQSLEEQYRSLDLRNQTLEDRHKKLEYRWQSLEERHHKFEEKLKAIESQGQASGLLEEQLPVQRNLAFMEMWQVQKRDHDTDLMKSGRVSRLNSAAP